MSGNIWQLQDAKNKFSRLVNNAQKNGPQIVTRHGKETVVVLAYEEYQRLSKQKIDLIEFFQKSPLAKLDLEFERNKDFPREVDL